MRHQMMDWSEDHQTQKKRHQTERLTLERLTNSSKGYLESRPLEMTSKQQQQQKVLTN